MNRFIVLVYLLIFSANPLFAEDDLTKTSPLYSEYNTFIKATNVLELVSVGSKEASVKVSFYKIDGTFQKAVRVYVPSLSQLDLDINTLVGRSDTYGLLKVEFNNSTARLQGRTSIYRLESSGEDYSFAYALPLRAPLTGPSYLTSNTFDPQRERFVVPNWLSLTNLSEGSARFEYNIYNQEGSLVSTELITLEAQQRIDVPGSVGTDQEVFLNEIVPRNPTTQYLANVVRYASRTKQGGKFNSYLYAMPVLASNGSDSSQVLPISNMSGECWEQTNWIEVANVSDRNSTFSLEFRKEDGDSIRFARYLLPARSQIHFNASNQLASRNSEFGTATVIPSSGDQIVTQSVVYYHDCNSNALQSAYNIRGITPGTEDPYISSFNRFLGMENELFILNYSGSSRNIDLTLRESGNIIHTSNSLIPFYGTINKSLNEADFGTTADTYGIIQVGTSQSTPLTGFNLRVRKTGTGNKTIDFSVPIELR